MRRHTEVDAMDASIEPTPEVRIEPLDTDEVFRNNPLLPLLVHQAVV